MRPGRGRSAQVTEGPGGGDTVSPKETGKGGRWQSKWRPCASGNLFNLSALPRHRPPRLSSSRTVACQQTVGFARYSVRPSEFPFHSFPPCCVPQGTSCQWLGDGGGGEGGADRWEVCASSEKKGGWGSNLWSPSPSVCLRWASQVPLAEATASSLQVPSLHSVDHPPFAPSVLGMGSGSPQWVILGCYTIPCHLPCLGLGKSSYYETPLHYPTGHVTCFLLGPQLIERVTHSV